MFHKNYVKTTYLLLNQSGCCFHENIFERGVNYFFSTVWQHCKIPIGIFRSIEDVNK